MRFRWGNRRIFLGLYKMNFKVKERSIDEKDIFRLSLAATIAGRGFILFAGGADQGIEGWRR